MPSPVVQCLLRHILNSVAIPALFEMLDKMDGEIDMSFSGNESFLRACCTIDPSVPSFLQLDQILPIANMFAYLGLNVDNLKAQVSVASNMFQVAVQVSNPHYVLVELLKMKEAFLTYYCFHRLY